MEEVGAGVSISPVAFLVVQGGTVKLLPVNHSSAIDKLLDYVPDLMEKVNSMFNKKIENKKEERETQENTSIHIPNMNKIYPKKNKSSSYEFEYDEMPIEYDAEENFGEE